MGRDTTEFGVTEQRVRQIAADVNAVAVVDEARTFAEADVTVSTGTVTQVASEAVELKQSANTGDSTVNGPGENNVRNGDPYAGILFEPNADVFITAVSGNPNPSTAGANYVTILDETDGGVVKREDVANGYGVTLDEPLDATKRYAFVLENQNGGVTSGGYNSGSYPYTSANADIVNGYLNSGGNGYFEAWASVTFTAENPPSGSASVAWGTPGTAPTDAFAWDVATFTQTLDGETVEVYVEEAQGSPGWTEVAGPLQRGDSIPADPSNDVRLRVDLSRADGTANPTLDSAARRYKL